MMETSLPPASTPSKPPSTSLTPSRRPPSSAAPSGSPHLRAPSPAAISISSNSVIAVDDDVDDDDEEDDEEDDDDDDDEEDDDEEDTDPHADDENINVDERATDNQLPPPSGDQHHARVTSSSSSAAAGGPDTDTDVDHKHHNQPHSTTTTTVTNHLIAESIVTTTTSTAVPALEQNPDGPPPSKKPKSKVARRARASPSPPPPPRRVPRMTIRLDIRLGGPANYEINVLQLAKETGQRAPTPPPVARPDDTDDSESDGGAVVAAVDPNATAVGDGAVAPIKRRKRKQVVAEYDYDDPFIDDSEIRIDAPTHIAQTKQQGFYVSSGEVALVKEKTPKKQLPPPAPVTRKPREIKPTLTSLLMNATAVAEAPTKVLAAASVAQGAPAEGAGTRDSPIALLDDEDMEHRKPSLFDMPPSKRVKLDGPPVLQAEHMNIGASDQMLASGPNGDANNTKGKRKISKESLEKIFHPTVTKALHELKSIIDQADWTVRGKFPPHIKPHLHQTAIVALNHGDYNDNFFDYLPTIFPYNRFTMMKLTSRLMFQDHQKFLASRQDALLEELHEIAREDYGKAQQDYTRSLAAWNDRQNRRLAEGFSGYSAGPSNPTDMDVDVPSRAGSPQPGGAESDAPGNKEKREREDREPSKRYKWTDQIKMKVWGLVHLSNESARLTGVMHGWDATIPITTEQSLRKNLYIRITSVFPEGWMSSQAISREVSNMKLKLKKEALPKVEKMEE